MDKLCTADFIAIDFETATEFMNSACSVGIAIVKNGEITDTFYSLIRPPENLYNAYNTSIHGITPEDTRSAPCFREVWNRILHLFGPYPVVAHNAKFDMSVLAMCCQYNGLNPQNFKYLDTINLAKDIVPGSKSLANCTTYFNIDLGNHHNALDDAIACAKIALCCLNVSGQSDLATFCFQTPHILVHNFSDLKPIEVLKKPHTEKPKLTKFRHFESVSPKDIAPCTSRFDLQHPLFGKNIVFTGELSIDRRTAIQMAVDVGATVKTAVSGKTDYLVVGMQDISLVGEDGMSSKEEKALELNKSGKAYIEVIRENEFLALISKGKAEVPPV